MPENEKPTASKERVVTERAKPKVLLKRKTPVKKKAKTDMEKSLLFFRYGFIATLFLCIGLSILAFNIANSSSIKLERIQTEALNSIEYNRQTLITGLYSINKVIKEEIPTRAERMEIYMQKAKGVILERNQETDLSDDELNNMLRVNFELSEKYMISPWMFLSFAAIESDFRKEVVSSAGASGIVQFMPSTMKIVLGEDYTEGIESNPAWSCKAWYKYISVISEAVGGDLKWTACAYMSPSAIKFKNLGKTIEEFMEWIVKISDNKESYPFQIEKTYAEYLER